MTNGWNHWADPSQRIAGTRHSDPLLGRNALKKKRKVRRSLV
jgi:hypothetical protein